MKNNKGFTLIELILVIGILSILSVALLVVLNPFAQFQKADDARRKSDLSQIQKALETYYQDNGKYPDSSGSDCGYTIPTTIGTCIAWGSSWGSYMSVVPKDPKVGSNYAYFSPDGQSYFLYASLERGSKDPQVCSSLNLDGSCVNMDNNGISDHNACGGPCNYGISTPDVSP